MALGDANYKFLYYNIGAPGSNSDGGIFNSTVLCGKLMNVTLNLPRNSSLPGRTKKVPYSIVADNAFALREHLLNPYSRRKLSTAETVYNYRLSRARRIIENIFGIASARFRVLKRAMEHKPENVAKIVSAVCILHNFCIEKSQQLYAPVGFLDSERNGI